VSTDKWKHTLLPKLIDRIVDTYADGKGINQQEGHDLPNRKVVDQALERLYTILFPGFADGHPVTRANTTYHIGDTVNHVQIELTKEVERAFRYACRVKDCQNCNVEQQAEKVVINLLESLPSIRQTLKLDVQAGFEGDPAASSMDEIILSYPAIRAIAFHRLANVLYKEGVPLIPRMWAERAHSETGIDIHPGATIGPSFFIDHGTGVVIGETCVIGSHVQIYQGVTLGALAPAKGQKIRGSKRHPTIEDNVIIYAGATILGGDTVIGQGAVVGGNVWLTDSVEPYTKVVIAKSDLLFLRPKSAANTPHKGEFACPARPLCEADGTIKPIHQTPIKQNTKTSATKNQTIRKAVKAKG